MNGFSVDAGAFNGSASLPLWLPFLPPRTGGRAVEPQTFLVPFIPRVVQQPLDVRDYDLDFRDVIPYDDTVTGATVTAEPPGLITDQLVTHPRVKVWIEGSHSGLAHKVTVVAHTAGGRAYEADIQVRIKDR
jgi:hypothetical protein